MLSIFHIVATSDEWMKYKIEVSANWYIAIEY